MSGSERHCVACVRACACERDMNTNKTSRVRVCISLARAERYTHEQDSRAQKLCEFRIQCSRVCVCISRAGDAHTNKTNLSCASRARTEMHTRTRPPKNGLIALLLTTNGLMCSKYISQKRNEAIDNCQWYKMLLDFIL